MEYTEDFHEDCEDCRWTIFDEYGHQMMIHSETDVDIMEFICFTCEIYEEYDYPDNSEDQDSFTSMLEQVIFLHCIPVLALIDEDFVPSQPVRFYKARKILSILKERNPKWQTMDSQKAVSTTASQPQTQKTLVRRLLNSPGSPGPVRRLLNSLKPKS